MSNERKQTSRDVEQNRSSRSKSTTNDSGAEQPQRFIYWDDEPIEEVSRLRKSNRITSTRNERKTK